MKHSKAHIPHRLTALLLALVLCLGMMPSAFAAQQDSYHDPAEHWQEANNRTNELDANAVVTIETFNCGECGKATSFEVFRTPEYHPFEKTQRLEVFPHGIFFPPRQLRHCTRRFVAQHLQCGYRIAERPAQGDGHGGTGLRLAGRT